MESVSDVCHPENPALLENRTVTWHPPFHALATVYSRLIVGPDAVIVGDAVGDTVLGTSVGALVGAAEVGRAVGARVVGGSVGGVVVGLSVGDAVMGL